MPSPYLFRYFHIPATIFLARRSLSARRLRTVLTLLGIALGVSVVLAIQITNQTTLDSLRQVFDRTTGQASLLVVPETHDGAALESILLPRLESVVEVQIAAPLLKGRTLPANQAQDWQIAFSLNGIASGNLLELYGIDPQVDPQVRVYELSQGEMPKWGKYEALITQKLAEEENLEVGDYLTILAPGSAASSVNGTVRLKLTGLLADTGVALLNGGNISFIPLDVAQEIFDRHDELDEIALRIDRSVSENAQKLEQLKERLSRRTGDDGRVIYPAARGQLVGQMLQTYQLGLTFFSVIAIFVGSFLIYNTFAMTVAERTREIGMLRVVGANRTLVLRMVLSEASLLSLVGSALGMAAGIFLARGLIRLMGNLVTSQDGALSIPWFSLVQSLAVGIFVTLLASLLPALKAARITPLEALRVRSNPSRLVHPAIWISGLTLILLGWIAIFRIHWEESSLFLIGNLALVCLFLGFTLTVPLVMQLLERITRPFVLLIYRNEGSIGSANIQRHAGRTTLTIASLMVALTMIISITSLAYSFEKDLTAWIGNALGGDLYVRSATPMRETYEHQLKSMDGVKAVTPARVIEVKAAPGQFPGEPSDNQQYFYFTALDPESYRQVSDMEFAANQGSVELSWQRLSQGTAVFVPTAFADRYNLHQGDDVILLTHRGEQAFTIAAEVVDFGSEGRMLYGTYSDLHRWFSEQGVDRFTLRVKPGYSIQEVAEAIDERYGDRWHISLQTTEDFRQDVLDLADQSFRLFDVLSLVGVIIGVLGVINTLTMNVLERRREIGGLRSLGMTRRQVRRMVMAEAQSLGVIGGIYGQVVGWIIAQALIRGLNLMSGYDLVYRFSLKPFLMSAIIALFVVQAAAFFPARRAARTNIIEAIQHE